MTPSPSGKAIRDYRALAEDAVPDVVIQALLTLSLQKVPDAAAIVRTTAERSASRGVREFGAQILTGTAAPRSSPGCGCRLNCRSPSPSPRFTSARWHRRRVPAAGAAAAPVGPSAQALHELLTAKGITHTFRLTDGRHEWVVWRHHLNEVAPLLFR